MSTCDRAEVLRDYAFDELPAAEIRGIEQHLETCEACAADLDRLRITTAALRSIPDREIPQRIAFVSDKVFAPSAAARFFSGFWNSGAQLGFASACVLGTALLVSAYHRTAPTAEVRTIVQTADVSKQVDEAVARAVAQVRDQVRQEDARLTQAAVDAAEARHEREQRVLLDAFQVLQKRLNTNTLLASADVPSGVVGQ
jgi:anti-sigma factor RsiW